MNNLNIITYIFLALSLQHSDTFSQIKEKFHKYPSIKYCHNGSESLFETYHDWMLIDDFNYFQLYSSYPKMYMNRYILGLGNNNIQHFSFEGDTAFYHNSIDCKSIFFVLSNEFYGDSVFIKSFGMIKRSWIKLLKVYYDLELSDSIFYFSVETTDVPDTSSYAVSLNQRNSIRVSGFSFSKRYGFYYISYDILDSSISFSEYYFPKFYKKNRKSRKRKYKQELRLNKISDLEKYSKKRASIYKKELKRLQK